jgi:3-hydroxybutyryl-CoA dehydratase
MSSLDLDFDDLEAGDRFEGAPRTVTGVDVQSFAHLTGDRHPLHTDSAWAAQSRFGEQVAHGLLAVSFAVGQLGFDPERVVALRGLDDVVFKRPVPFRSELTVEGVVEDTRELDDQHGLVTLRLRIKADGRLAVTARVVAVWSRQPSFVPLPL